MHNVALLCSALRRTVQGLSHGATLLRAFEIQAELELKLGAVMFRPYGAAIFVLGTRDRRTVELVCTGD